MILGVLAWTPTSNATPLTSFTDTCFDSFYLGSWWGGSSSGRVYSLANPSDYYKAEPAGTVATYRLEPFGGDADLYVWNNNCSSLLCSSAAGGTTVDTCSTSAARPHKVEVSYFSSSTLYVDYEVSFSA